MAVDVSTAARAPLGAETVRALARFVLARRKVRHAILSIAFVTPRAIAALNRRTLGHRGATDVVTLAFRRRSEAEPVVGDIYIAPVVVRRNASRAGVGVREECARVVLHGVLHALGFDHADVDREAGIMWRTQERLLIAARRQRLW